MIVTTDVAQMQLAACATVYDSATVIRGMEVTVEPADASQIAMMYKTQVTHRVEFILSAQQDGLDHPLMYSVT